MLKYIVDSLTFTSATARIAAAGNGLAVFALGDPIFCWGTNLNNGHFQVTAVDPGGAFLTVDPPPKDEGPVALAGVRTE
jgi:hypothetical protein